MRLLLAALLTVAALPSALLAQYMVAPVTSGTRVRVTAPQVAPDPVRGSFLSAERDTVRVAASGGNLMVAVPVASVARFEVSEGRERGRWAFIGAGIGMLGGAIIGAVEGGRGDTTGVGAFGGFLLGGIMGLPAGIIGGALLAPERWRDHPVSMLR